MGNARNVGGHRARCGQRAQTSQHYLTAREAAGIARQQRAKAEARGIFHRWNRRKLTPEQQALADEALKRDAFHAKRAARRKARAPATPPPPLT